MHEVDIQTGAVLWTWNALDHVAVQESIAPPSDPSTPFDYFHGNSIDLTPDGRFLILSARNTCTIYKVDRTTGSVVWRLRGANDRFVPQNPLTLAPPGESFWYQHDARIHPDGSLSLFDDGGEPFVHNARGLVMAINETAMTATIQREDDGNIAVGYMGSYRSQLNGNWLAGWGNVPRLTEFAVDGGVALDIALTNYSYRALRFDWHATPSAPPDVAAARNADGTVSVWASWNGATEVANWSVLAGPDAGTLAPIGTFPRAGFETAMTVVTARISIAVAALDAQGNTLGTSAAVSIEPLADHIAIPMISSDG